MLVILIDFESGRADTAFLKRGYPGKRMSNRLSLGNLALISGQQNRRSNRRNCMKFPLKQGVSIPAIYSVRHRRVDSTCPKEIESIPTHVSIKGDQCYHALCYQVECVSFKALEYFAELLVVVIVHKICMPI